MQQHHGGTLTGLDVAHGVTGEPGALWHEACRVQPATREARGAVVGGKGQPNTGDQRREHDRDALRGAQASLPWRTIFQEPRSSPSIAERPNHTPSAPPSGGFEGARLDRGKVIEPEAARGTPHHPGPLPPLGGRGGHRTTAGSSPRTADDCFSPTGAKESRGGSAGRVFSPRAGGAVPGGPRPGPPPPPERSSGSGTDASRPTPPCWVRSPGRRRPARPGYARAAG